MIKLHLDNHFLSKLNDEISKARLPAYRPIAKVERGKYVSEDEISAVAVGMKVNNCHLNPTQGRDRSKRCPFCPTVPSSEFHVAWQCPKVRVIRRDVGIDSFKNVMSLNKYVSDEDSYFAYINGFDSNSMHVSHEEFETRIKNLGQVKSLWLSVAKQ